MKTLFLQVHPPHTSPIAEWLGPEVGRDAIVVAPKHLAPLYADWAAQVVSIERYTPFGETDCVALDLARKHRVEHIIAAGECDIVRAAELRRMLGLPGQNVESARAFRDKVVMKRIVSAAGIEVADHVSVTTPLEVIEFVERVGFPIVGKPFSGLGSIGTIVLRDRAQLEAVLWREPEIRGIIEAFVPGDMFHVDGFVWRGEPILVSPSRYVNGMLAFQRNEHCLSVQLDPDHPLRARLVDFALRVLRSMPLPEATPFHMEVFHTPDDRLVFCEIASRVPGIRIGDAITQSYGFNLGKTWMEMQLGLRAHIDKPQPPKGVAGTAIVPPRAGRIESFARTLDVPGIVDIHVECKEGDVFAGADSSASALAIMVGQAPNERELVSCLEAGVDAFQKSCRYAEGPTPAAPAGPPAMH